VHAVFWTPYSWAVDEPAFRYRNSQLTPLQRLGRTEWKVATGLGQRSRGECTNNRLKSSTGVRLAARAKLEISGAVAPCQDVATANPG
jgi:hypothetical protein